MQNHHYKGLSLEIILLITLQPSVTYEATVSPLVIFLVMSVRFPPNHPHTIPSFRWITPEGNSFFPNGISSTIAYSIRKWFGQKLRYFESDLAAVWASILILVLFRSASLLPNTLTMFLSRKKNDVASSTVLSRCSEWLR